MNSQPQIRKFLRPAWHLIRVGLCLVSTAACTKIDFVTPLSSKLSDPQPFGCAPNDKSCGLIGGGNGGGGSGGGGDGTTGGDTPDPKKGIFEFSSSFNRDYVWVVTNKSPDTKVYQIKLDEKSGSVLKTWTIKNSPQTGARTYVTSVGLFIGKQGGNIYRVDETMSEDTPLTPVWRAPSPSTGTRMCLTSFSLNSKPYLGVGWENSAGNRVFTRFPIDSSMPQKVDFASAQSEVQGSGSWSYGCFTDQKRNYFWSAWGSGGNLAGVDLATLKPLDPKLHAPNAGHFNSTLGVNFQLNPSDGKNGNYALAGDANGNVLSGNSIYTYAHDSRSNVVLGTQKGATKMIIANPNCYSKETTCAGKYFEADLTSVGHIRPLSSMNDGRIIGIVRASISRVYVLKVKDPNDLSKLVDATLVAEVPGDAYMYNDFTGFSLYANNIDLSVELDKLDKFDPEKNVRSLSLVWAAQGGGASKWEGLTIEARCYKQKDKAEGKTIADFVKIDPIKDAGQETLISAASCQDAKIDRLDLKLRAATSAGSNFTRTSLIQILGSH